MQQQSDTTGERRALHRVAPGFPVLSYLGLVMAAGAPLAPDASLPGGCIEGSGSMRYGQTMAFNTLVLLPLFNIFNARSEE
jgi:hypothetical protein